MSRLTNLSTSEFGSDDALHAAYSNTEVSWDYSEGSQ